MISESDGKGVQDRRLSIIDVSSADDSLLDPVSGNFLSLQHSENQEHVDLLYTPNSKKFEDATTKVEQWEQEPPSNEAFETGKTKRTSKCNLRKSLAWDSAFFTSAGVLDPEELSSIIEGIEKKEALPKIEEDVYKSCDSLSTLASDSLTLESMEVEGDIFEDVRASIQKSSCKSNLSSRKTKVLSPSGLPGFQSHDPSRKVAVVSRNKMKISPPASRNPTTSMQGVGKMTPKNNPKFPQLTQVPPPASRNPSASMQGVGKITPKNNPKFPQLPQKPVAIRRESSISKLSKVPGSFPGSTISSKRVSLGDLHVKSDKDKAKRIIGG